MISSILSIVACWSLLGAVFVGIGAAFRRGCGAGDAGSLGADFWTGFALALGALQLLHIAVPMGPGAAIVIGVAGTAGLAWSREAIGAGLRDLWRDQSTACVVFAVLAVALANRGLSPLLTIDAGLYHLGAIQWAAQHPLVDGLGNLHGRFAFNSAWFPMLAAFDVDPRLFRSFQVLPGLLLLAATASCSAVILDRRMAPTSGLVARVFAAVLLLPLVYAAAMMQVSATSPDWPILFVGVALALALMRISFARSSQTRLVSSPTGLVSSQTGLVSSPTGLGDLLTIALLAAAGTAIKLSFAAVAAAALVVAIAACARQQNARSVRGFVLAALAIAFIALPWSYRSVRLSGYPAYPSTAFAFDVTWRVPAERVEAETQWIRSWARAPGKEPRDVLGSSAWLRPWLAARMKTPESIALLVTPAVAIGVALLAMGGVGARPRRSLLRVATPFAIGCAFWFAQAPDARFLAASLWVCAAALLADPFAAALEARSRAGDSRRVAGVAALAVGAALALAFLGFVGELGFVVLGRTLERSALDGRRPVPTIATKPFETRTGLVLRVPSKGDKCWEAPLPCTPYPAPRLGLRIDGDLASGFELK